MTPRLKPVLPEQLLSCTSFFMTLHLLLFKLCYKAERSPLIPELYIEQCFSNFSTEVPLTAEGLNPRSASAPILS